MPVGLGSEPSFQVRLTAPARRAERGVVGIVATRAVGAEGMPESTTTVTDAIPTPRPATSAVVAVRLTASPSGNITPAKVTAPAFAVAVTAVPPLMLRLTVVPLGASVLRVTVVVRKVKTAPATGLVNASIGGLPTSTVHIPLVALAFPAGSVALRRKVVVPAKNWRFSKVDMPPMPGTMRVSVRGMSPVRVRVSVTG
ncbi:MAG: hypothetical protein IPF99_28480 [Deltaproteobacteria bacterium]|nr:hypothetical protein [Deltaproteobacteria bacterium]